jgi:hypothetical protein
MALGPREASVPERFTEDSQGRDLSGDLLSFVCGLVKQAVTSTA